MREALVMVQCDNCGQVYQVLKPATGFPAPCGLCKPTGAGQIRPVAH
jgi:hypothetical protein